MKRNNFAFLLTICLTLLLAQPTFIKAVSSTPTTTITNKPTVIPTQAEGEGLGDKIKELKDKLASRVAELNVVSQKIITGTIKTLSDEKIILSADEAEINAEINEETVIYELGRDYKKSELKLDSLKTGEQVVTWGGFNSETNTINTKNVYRLPDDLSFVGKIKGIDKRNFQVTVTDTENTDYMIDVELDTKVNQYDASKGLLKIGFSKLVEGQFVYVLAEPSSAEKNLVSGKTIVVIFEPTSISTPTPTKSEE